MLRGTRSALLAALIACAALLGPAASAAYVDESPTARIMAVGDVMLGWEVGRAIVNNGPQAPWRHVAGILDDADLLVANLECVIARGGVKWPSKLIHLRAPLRAAESLMVGGVDLVSVANNHALDFGRDAFSASLSAIGANGIRYAGGGANSTAARAARIVDVNGLDIAFLGYSLPFSTRTTFNTREWEATATLAGMAIGTPERVAADVRLARQHADVVVVMVHGGKEYAPSPNKQQRLFAQAAVAAGAALVIGHHPHVLQGYARSANTLIAYSLGNFVFARFEGASNDSAILDVTLSEDGVQSFRFIPVVIERGIPRPAVGAEIDRITARLPAL
jgi:poly-gamma-glutamate synthesis protein (capsule biosynthesis protein)